MVGVVAAVAVDPLIDAHHVLNISDLTNNGVRFITCHSITSMDDFEYTHHDETHNVVKMYNDRYQIATQK